MSTHTIFSIDGRVVIECDWCYQTIDEEEYAEDYDSDYDIILGVEEAETDFMQNSEAAWEDRDGQIICMECAERGAPPAPVPLPSILCTPTFVPSAIKFQE